MNRLLRIGLFLSLATTLIFSVVSCRQKSVSNWDQLKLIEIKQYQGENLSSVADFVENSIKGPQIIDINTYKLKVDGLVNNQIVLTYDEVLKNYTSEQRLVQLNCVEGWSVKILWEGVPLKDLITQANPAPDANTVIFHCVDGYTTSEPLSYLVDNDIIMAYKVNGITLPPERGYPFMVVAQEKWGYKWAKWVTEIEFSNNANYKGYWESRGFSNNGDLDKSFVGP
ncbi:MAG: molybdopterin-dependent oxidoreductase [Dehalococcoidales bacterium]|nr:molybdopterin-dependent oxidoreductase [Dehalococcoidales bacterium]